MIFYKNPDDGQLYPVRVLRSNVESAGSIVQFINTCKVFDCIFQADECAYVSNKSLVLENT